MNEGPLISIIVPVYNVEKYLDRCIKSILRQTYRNFELLLIDDGSPDRCPALCDEWAKKDSRIRVFHKVNGGLSDARNYGVAMADSEFITFVDSDDGVSACKELFTELKVTTMAWSKLYRREIIDFVNFPAGRNYEDCATICKYLYASRDFRNRIAVSQEPLYYACWSNNSSICHTKSLKNLTDSLWSGVERARFFTRKKEKQLSKMAWNLPVCRLYKCMRAEGVA